MKRFNLVKASYKKSTDLIYVSWPWMAPIIYEESPYLEKFKKALSNKKELLPKHESIYVDTAAKLLMLETHQVYELLRNRLTFIDDIEWQRAISILNG